MQYYLSPYDTAPYDPMAEYGLQLQQAPARTALSQNQMRAGAAQPQRARRPVTYEELAAKAEAEAPSYGTEEEKKSLLSSLYEGSLGGLAYIGSTLDKFGGRAIRGLLGGNPRELLSVIPFSDTLGITDPSKTTEGSDLLEMYGLASGDDSLMKTIAGLGLEIGLDPMTYIGIGGLTRAGRAAQAAGKARPGLMQGIRSGERAMLEVGLPFMPSTNRYIGVGEEVADAIGTVAASPLKLLTNESNIGLYDVAKRVIDEPLSKTSYGYRPVEATVTALGDYAQRGLGKAKAIGSYLFDPAVANASTLEIQDIARSKYDPAASQLYDQFAPSVGALNEMTATAGNIGGAEVQRRFDASLRRQQEIPSVEQAGKLVDQFLSRELDEISQVQRQLADGKISGEEAANAQAAIRDKYENLIGRTRYSQDRFRQRQVDELDYLKGVLGADFVDEAMQTVDNLGKTFQQTQQVVTAAGGNMGNIGLGTDIISYGPRRLSPEAQGLAGRADNYGALRTANPNEIARLDAFRYIPGGTEQIDEWLTNPEVKNMTPQRLREYIENELTGGSGGGLLIQPASDFAKRQADQIAQIIENADPKLTKPGSRYFANNYGEVVKDYARQQGKRLGQLDTVMEGIAMYAKNAKAFKEGEAVPVMEVLNRIGANLSDQAKTQLFDKANMITTEKIDPVKFAIPKQIAEDMVRVGSTWETPEALRPVTDIYNRSLQAFKTYVTAPFVSFYTRNLMSGEYNKFRAGALSQDSSTAMLDVLRGGNLPEDIATRLYPGETPEKATRLFNQELLARDVAYTKRNRTSTEQLGDEALFDIDIPKVTETGSPKPVRQVLKDYVAGFKALPAEEAGGFSSARQYLDPLLTQGVGVDKEGRVLTKDINRVISQGRLAGFQIENYLRGSHYLERRLQGFTPQAAAADSAKYHLDYGRLTEFERKYAKSFIPWYSFSRRNLPSILEDMIDNPARIATPTRVISGSRDRDQFVPQFVAEGASFPIGTYDDGKMARVVSSFGLPMEDEAIKTLGTAMSGDVRRTLQQVLGMGVPYIKMPFEQAFDTQLFSGRRLSDLDPGVVASLGYTLPDRVAQGMSQFISNTPAARAVSTVDRFFDPRKGAIPQGLNFLTGMRISDIDLERAKLAAQRTQLEELLRPSREVKIREEAYVPKDQLKNLDPEERKRYDLYMDIRKQQSELAKRRQSQ